jgi:hypothetical protein
MKQISALLFLWGVVSAWAMAGAAEIAAHPLHIEAAPSGMTAGTLKRVFQEQVSRAMPEQTDIAEVERFLRQRGEASCWGDDGCIVALANAVRAKRVLLVSVVRTEPWIIMSARVLDARGAELRNIPIAVHTPDADLSESANFADGFSSLFTALNLRELLSESASLTKSQAVSQEGLSSMRIASYTAAGVAAIGIAAGVTFTALYLSDQDKYKKLLGETGVSSSDNSEQALKYMQRSQDHRLYFIIGYSVAAAAAAASVTLFFLSPEYKTKPVVSFIPLQGGGTLTVSAYF